MTSQLFPKFLYLTTLSSLIIGYGKRYSKPQGDYIYYQVDSLADSSFSYDGIIKLENSLIDSIKIDAIVKNKISANKLGDFFLESNYMKVDSSSITYIYYNFTRQKPDGDDQDYEKIARIILFSDKNTKNPIRIRTGCIYNLASLSKMIKLSELYQRSGDRIFIAIKCSGRY